VKEVTPAFAPMRTRPGRRRPVGGEHLLQVPFVLFRRRLHHPAFRNVRRIPALPSPAIAGNSKKIFPPWRSRPAR